MPALEPIDPKVIGPRLAEARKARGLTQEEASTHLGCSRPTLIAIEKGARQPKAVEIVILAFLMPSTSVRRRFNQIVNESGDFRIADLCRLSHFYFVSVEAMTLRLEGLGLIPKGVRDHLKESRFEVRRAVQTLNLRQHPVADNRFSDRYVFLAVQAYDQGELSEGELASLLRCDRVTAREVVQQYLTTTEVSD